MGTAPSRNDRELSHEARGRSGGRVDDVEAVQSHEDAIAATTSSSSSFFTPSQYLADDNLGVHEETLDLRRPTASRVDALMIMKTPSPRS